MFVPDIQVVKAPDEWIPSRVGFYVIQDEMTNGVRDLLLFQSAIQGGYKFLPSIAHWKSSPFCRNTTAIDDHLVPQQIECAPEVMQNIANLQGNIVRREVICTDIDAEMIGSLPRIVFNSGGMEIIGARESANHRVNVSDVLFGPLNLFV